MKKRLIAILTDFGVSDNYNGVMEGVIRKINPNVDITYITPNAKEFNILAGAYLLYTAYKYFPKNTIFLVVVDPGVGTQRKALVVKTSNYYFIGPDNGILYPSIKEDGIRRIIQIKNPRMYLSKNISSTFHGRDIFSVASAFISLNVDLGVFGDEISENEIEKITLDYYEKKEENKTVYCGKIIYIDHFGNVTTSIKAKLHRTYSYYFRHRDRKYQLRVVKTFGEASSNELLVYVNSYGFVEIGINKGSAGIVINAREGDDVCLEAYTQGDFSHST